MNMPANQTTPRGAITFPHVRAISTGSPLQDQLRRFEEHSKREPLTELSPRRRLRVPHELEADGTRRALRARFRYDLVHEDPAKALATSRGVAWLGSWRPSSWRTRAHRIVKITGQDST